MKVIDLLNKIANGEEVPEKIKYNNEIYNFDDNYGKYYDENSNTLKNAFRYYHLERCLNDEVKIIEEDKKIEKITMRAGMVGSIDNKLENLNINIIAVEDKINEIIDKLEKEQC